METASGEATYEMRFSRILWIKLGMNSGVQAPLASTSVN